SHHRSAPTYASPLSLLDPLPTSAAANCLDWSTQLLDRDYLMSLASSSQAGREVWMFDNDLKTPYSDQISLGIRNTFEVMGHDWKDRKSTRLNSSHVKNSYAVFCL